MAPASSPHDARPAVVVVGPGPEQIGGLATFVAILLASPVVRQRYRPLHLATTRGKRGAGTSSRLSLLNLWYFARQAAALARMAVRQRPKILHVPLTSGWAFFKDTAFVLLGRLFGMRVVAHLHGGLFDRYYRGSPPPVRALIRWGFRRADVVVALSERWRQFLLDEVDGALPVVVAPNSIGPEFAALAEGDGAAPRDANLVVFMGSIGKRKGVFDLLAAAPAVLAQHPDARFALAGDEEFRGERAAIEEAIAAADLQERVRLLGAVTGDAKLALLRRATVFVLPSRGENLPYALLEAMASGLPTVVTAVGAVPEVVRDGAHGFVIQPADCQSLADRISRLLGDPALRQRMGVAGQELMRRDYLPDAAMRRFVAIYDTLLQEERR